LFSKNNTYKYTIQLIAEILSFENSNEYLRKKLKSGNIDWDTFVMVSSRQLVLTTCYCRLEQRELLNLIPDDLVLYLKDITTINRNRNLKLIDEIKEISQAFQTAKIDYVLLKGSALLIGNYYKDCGERMVGDVDILVSPRDISKAYQLIKDLGYQQSIGFNYENKEFRHLPRQFTGDKFAAIELHSSVLDQKYKNHIDDKLILKNKTNCNGINIPSSYFLNITNIMGVQINSKGYRYRQWFLRTMYDSVILNLVKEKKLLDDYRNNKYVNDYLAKYWAIFKYLKLDGYSKKMNSKIRYYNLKLRYYSFNQMLYKLKYTFYNLYDRFILFLANMSYRANIFKKLMSVTK